MRVRKTVRGDLGLSEVGMAVGALVDRSMRWPEESVALLEAAVDVGISFLDAPAGPRQESAERLLGAALRSVRTGVTVATAFAGRERGPLEDEREPDWSVRAVGGAIDRSLSRFGLEPIGLFQLSGPPKPAVRSDELFSFLDGQVASGKLLAYGLTIADDAPDRHAVDTAMDVLDLRSFATVQVPERAYQAAREPLTDVARGTGAGMVMRQSGGAAPTLETLHRAASARGQTAAQAALAFLLAEPEVVSVLVSVRDAGHLAEMASAGEAPQLTPEEVESIRDEAAGPSRPAEGRA